MKQTAVEWLYEHILLTPLDIRSINKCLEQAKAMEKQQIIEAWDNGFANGYDLGKYNDECSPEDAEQYYTETYESKTNL